MGARVRRRVNGIVVVASLVAVLPVIVVAERVRGGAGRRIAVAAVRVISRACGIRYDAIGLDRVPPGRAVLVPNHASPVDIPALLATAPHVRFVAAAELLRVPLLGAAIRALGSIPVDRSRPRSGNGRLEGVLGDDARSIVVFAEGGIPEPGVLPRFHTGAFVLAIEAGAPVVPVTIHGAAAVLPRGDRIWANPGVITVEYHDAIETSSCTLRDRKRLRDETEQAVRGARPR